MDAATSSAQGSLTEVIAAQAGQPASPSDNTVLHSDWLQR